MNTHGSFSEEALRTYQELASAQFRQAPVGQGTEHLANEPFEEKKPLPKKAAAKHQGTEEADRYDELDKDPEFAQPRCENGMWRYPPETGICQPKQAVIAKKQSSERDRLNDALRNRLESLKKTQKHKANQKEAKDPVVVNKVVERKSPTVKLDNTAVVGVLMPDGKLEVLEYGEGYDFTAVLRG